MLDKEGYRPNVGIILANRRNEVFWGKRVNQHAWQFPQGGIKHGETPLQAMYPRARGGDRPAARARAHPRPHARLAALRGAGNWLRRDCAQAPTGDRSRSGSCCAWSGRDCDVKLRASGHPEFDAWRWHDYWVPLETVIDFKREVYRQALIELHRYLQADRRARPRRPEGAQPAHP